MRWYDVVRDNERNAATLAAGGDAQSPQERKGYTYRLDDGTAIGRWRVCIEDDRVPEAERTWAVWDMRRGGDSPTKVRPVKVIGGIVGRDRALLLASLVVQLRPLRAALAGLRMAKGALDVAMAVPKAIREEWRL